jgi:protocatechuate 3,4-dioxygenase beta subunit
MRSRRRSLILSIAAGAALVYAASRGCGFRAPKRERVAAARATTPGGHEPASDPRPAPSVDSDRLAAAREQLRLHGPGLLAVTGVVSELETGAPIPGADVVLAGVAGETSTVTDDDGRYTAHVAPGLYRVFARADDHIAVGRPATERLPGRPDPADLGAPDARAAPLLDVQTDRSEVDLVLSGAAEITGTVFDAAGRPVAGALVAGEQLEAVPVLGLHMDETDLDGSYRIVVPAGLVFLDAVHAAYGGVEGERSHSLEPGDHVRADLTLVAGCIIRGSVVDAAGRPVDGALEVHRGGEPPHDFAPIGRVDERGRFRLAVMHEGPLQIRAWPWKSPPAAPQRFDCTDGARHDDVRFVAPDADADLEGSVVGADGEPVPHAFVDVIPLDPGGMLQQERADADGEWAVYALPPGAYRVVSYVPERGVGAAHARAPARGVKLRLGGTGAIAGRVLGMSRGTLRMTVEHCAIGGPDDEMDGVMLDDVTMSKLALLVPVADGQFRIDGLPACVVVGRVEADGRAEAFAAEVQAGQVAPLDFDLR